MKMFSVVPKGHSIDTATNQSYFPSKMFCGSQDDFLNSPVNDVRWISVNTQDGVLRETYCTSEKHQL